MKQRDSKKFLIFSACFHFAVLIVLVLSIDFMAPLVVIENTNKQDVISAVVLGDTAKSKIIPQKITPPPPVKKVEKETVKEVVEEKVKEPAKNPPEAKPAVVEKKPAEKVIALKQPEKKKPSDIFAKDLLKDIEQLKKKSAKLKKDKQKKLQAQFQKTLRLQAEKTMRSHLLDEDLQMKSSDVHASQGVVNKYQALIQQAISQHWVVPPQTNKKLSSVLLIRLAPGGVVLDVQVTKSSGDRALDSSARAAVLKASPLPVPKESADFEPFRQFNLKVRPENIEDDRFAG